MISNKKLNYGFTLIELLVVIAIIGILTSVVLASLNTARSKGSNAAVKSNLHGIRSQAEIYYDDAAGGNNSYVGLCATTNVVTAMSGALLAGGDTGAVVDRCYDSATAWAANAAFKEADADGNTYWCVDSESLAKGEAAPLGVGVTQCP